MRTIAHHLAIILRPYLASVHGRENLPKPPFILASNHISPLDPALLLAATGLPIHFLAAGHLFQRWWGFMRLYNELIIRHLGKAIATGPGSIERTLAVLAAGGIVGIFPEGDIYPTLRQNRLHTGTAVIAQQAHVPIIPVRIEGSERIWTFTKTFAPQRFRAVHITIGSPIPPPKTPLDRNRTSTFVEELMKTILVLHS